jgi:hypothetical protein
MAIEVVVPTGAVTTFDNGLIAVRCFDFVGPGRGTLTTAADAASVAGDVVIDTQEQAVQTTYVDQFDLFDLSDDSVVMPIATIGFVPNIGYEIYVGARITGDAPANAQAHSTMLAFNEDGASVGWAMGYDGNFYQGPEWMARSIINQYVLHRLPSGWFESPGFATDLTLRGWGITGGDIEIRFDMVYFVPIATLDEPFPPKTDFDVWSGADAEDYQALKFASNGTFFRNNDDDPASWIGDHSVLNWRFPWTEEEGLVDMQGDDDEVTVDDIGGDNMGRPTWLTFPSGSLYIPAQNIITDTFGQADFTQAWITGDYFGKCGNLTLIAGPPFTGTYIIGSQLKTFFPAMQTLPQAWAIADWGGKDHTVDLTDPSLQPRDLLGHSGLPSFVGGIFYLPAAVVTTKINFDSQQVQGAELGLGYPLTGQVSDIYMDLALNDSGDGEVSLKQRGAANANDPYIIDGPVGVISGYTPGAFIWMKVQRRGYHWRARVWMDGDAEPSTWDVEGYEGLGYRNNANTIRDWIDHPYDTNWPGPGADADIVTHDPRGPTGDDFTPQLPFLAPWVGPGYASPSTSIADVFTVDWEPDGDTPVDTNVQVEAYNGGDVEGPITVPYGPQRMIYGDFRLRSYNSGVNGLSIRAWLDAGAPTIQTAGVGEIFARAIIGGFIPQIYRRVLG